MYTLEQAAAKLGMQKKTLDDYYYKLKAAQAMGFDVEKNRKEKIGVLRKFVKDNKKKGLQIQQSPQPWGSAFFSPTTHHFSPTTTSVASSSSFASHPYHPSLPQKPP